VSNWTDAKGRSCPERRAPDPTAASIRKGMEETIRELKATLADRDAVLAHVRNQLRTLLDSLALVK
jgi:hypothetical protein